MKEIFHILRIMIIYNIKLKVEDHPMMVQGHKMHALRLQAHNLMHLHLYLKVSSS
jgi:hypothetical protein